MKTWTVTAGGVTTTFVSAFRSTQAAVAYLRSRPFKNYLVHDLCKKSKLSPLERAWANKLATECKNQEIDR